MAATTRPNTALDHNSVGGGRAALALASAVAALAAATAAAAADLSAAVLTMMSFSTCGAQRHTLLGYYGAGGQTRGWAREMTTAPPHMGEQSGALIMTK